METRARRIRRYAPRILAGIGVVVAVFLAWNAAQVWLAWRSIDRVQFDLDESRAVVAELAETAPSELSDLADDGAVIEAGVGEPTAAQTVFAEDDIDVFLLVGSDGVTDDALGRADAVLLWIRPEGGHAPLLMSLPRDLVLVNPCTRQPARLTRALEGCGTVSGPELLALMVEDFTTLTIDHFAVIGFGAFGEVIDRLGGIQVCVQHESRFDLTTFPAGCSTADGSEALAWIRSRTPEEYVDGAWRPADTGDQARSDRQQQLLVQLLGRLRRFRSPLEMSDLVGNLADAVVLDDTLSMGAAIDIAWEMRNVDPGSIQRPVLPVREQTLQGKFVRIPTQPFPDLLSEVYGS